MEQAKYATLFGGAMNDTKSQEYNDTIEIGSLLATQGYVVKNGGYRGMMEAVSKGATESGGIAIGYTCRSFGSYPGNEYLTYEMPQDDLYDRLRQLIEGTNLFVVQKGGIGTIAELMLTLDIVRKIKGERPRIILVGAFWAPIMESMKQLMHPKEQNLWVVVNDLGQFKTII